MNPYPHPDSVIIADNLIVHKCPVLEETLSIHGVHYLYLPPYSPFFNPIEECFGYIKTVCKRNYKEYEGLTMKDAIHNAFGKITSVMIKGYYKHAGYE